MAKRTLSVEEVAKHFGVSVGAIRAWKREGMPARSGGGHGKPLKFDRDAVLAWAAKNGKASVSTVTGVEAPPEEEKKIDFLDLDQQRAELTRVQKWIAKDRLRIIRGKYLRRSEVQEQITDCISYFAGQLQRFDEHLDASPEVKDQIRRRMEALLNKMADELNEVPKIQTQRQKNRHAASVDQAGKSLAKQAGK